MRAGDAAVDDVRLGRPAPGTLDCTDWVDWVDCMDRVDWVDWVDCTDRVAFPPDTPTPGVLPLERHCHATYAHGVANSAGDLLADTRRVQA